MDQIERVYIGDVVKRIRDAKNIKQDELAFNVGITRKAMSNIESNVSSPKIGTLFAIAKALDMMPSEFMKEVEEYMDKNKEKD